MQHFKCLVSLCFTPLLHPFPKASLSSAVLGVSFYNSLGSQSFTAILQWPLYTSFWKKELREADEIAHTGYLFIHGKEWGQGQQLWECRTSRGGSVWAVSRLRTQGTCVPLTLEGQSLLMWTLKSLQPCSLSRFQEQQEMIQCRAPWKVCFYMSKSDSILGTECCGTSPWR